MASSTQTPTQRTAAQADTFWTRLSPTTRHAGCLGILLVVALAFYAPAVFEGKNIQGTDSITFRANAQVTVEHHQKTGEWARWAPNVFSGTPYINEQISVLQLDDVVNLVRGAAWPVSLLFVLMAGVYLLAFYLTRNHLSGLLSGLAFGFTTYIPIIIGVGHGTKFVALAYAPYVVLAGRPGLDGDESIGYVVAADFGDRVGESIAYAYLPSKYADAGTAVQVMCEGATYDATVRDEPLFDAGRSKIRR